MLDLPVATSRRGASGTKPPHCARRLINNAGVMPNRNPSERPADEALTPEMDDHRARHEAHQA